MILPILRLVLIYLLLVAGVVAVFNRDKLAVLFPGASDREAAAATAPAEAPSPPAELPASDEAPQDTPTATGQGAPAPEFPDPVFPDPVAPDPTAPEVSSAAQTPQPHPGPAQAAGAGQGNTAAPVARTDPQSQPAAPGSPAPLGTPIATAPQADAAPAPAAAPEPPAEPAPAAPTAQVTEEAETPPGASPGTVPLAEAIAAARAAYWAGDIEGARARMDALVAAHPDNAEVAGELGNLAFALRDYPAAAEAWHRAGLLLIDRGEGARVMSFLPFLQSIAPAKAADLADRLRDR